MARVCGDTTGFSRYEWRLLESGEETLVDPGEGCLKVDAGKVPAPRGLIYQFWAYSCVPSHIIAYSSMSNGPMVDRLGNESGEMLKRVSKVGWRLDKEDYILSLRRLNEACLLCEFDFGLTVASDADVEFMPHATNKLVYQGAWKRFLSD